MKGSDKKRYEIPGLETHLKMPQFGLINPRGAIDTPICIHMGINSMHNWINVETVRVLCLSDLSLGPNTLNCYKFSNKKKKIVLIHSSSGAFVINAPKYFGNMSPYPK